MARLEANLDRSPVVPRDAHMVAGNQDDSLVLKRASWAVTWLTKADFPAQPSGLATSKYILEHR